MSTSQLQKLIKDYKETSLVPKHPKNCPQCGAKVKKCHINYEDFLILCSNDSCLWPLTEQKTSEEIVGKSDVTKFAKINHEKRKIRGQDSGGGDLSDASYRSEDEKSPSKKKKKFSSEIVVEAVSKNFTKSDDGNLTNKKKEPKLAKPSSPVEESLKSKVEVAPSDGDNEVQNHVDLDSNEIDMESQPCSPSISNTTPARTDDEFVNPNAVAVTPRRNMTPFHVPELFSPLPVPVSPLQMTPKRSRDSERSVSDEMHIPRIIALSPLPMTPYRSLDSERSISEDLMMTDSELSDIEKTPRHQQKKSDALDMPTFNSPRPPRPTYSKDLSQLSSPDSRTQQEVPSSPTSESSSSGIKMLLKRNKSQEWNTSPSPKEDVVLPDRPISSGKPPLKLDKVVLNLKKTAENTWNVAEKKNESEPEQQPLPKEERRGRKSKSVPMKIQNVEEIANEIPPAPACHPPTSSSSPPHIEPLQSEEPAPNDIEISPTTDDIVDITSLSNDVVGETEKCIKVSNQSEKIKSKEELTPSKSNNNIKKSCSAENATIEENDAATKRLSTGMAITRTFQRSKKKANMEKLAKVTPNKNFRKPPIINSEPQLPDNWKEVAKLSSEAASALKINEEFSEVSQLMKAATGERDIDLGFLQKIQHKLSLKHTAKTQVTFHVGQGKASIDLPSDDTSMSLSDPKENVQMMLTSNSDGIIGDMLKEKDEHPSLHVEPKKRGRPKQKPVPRPDPPPSMVQPNDVYHHRQPYEHFAALPTQGFYRSLVTGVDEFFANPANIQNFKETLSYMMQGFVMPHEWEAYNIDPFVAMMVTRSQDIAYSGINFDALIQLYGRMVRHEATVMNPHAYANQGYDPGNSSSANEQTLDLSSNKHQPQPSTSSLDSAPSSSKALRSPNEQPTQHPQQQSKPNDRTYTELQTVRSGGKDANQVLRQHQEASTNSSPEISIEKNPATPKVNPMPSSNSNTSERIVIKQEAMTPMQPPNPGAEPGSVCMLSVRPAPASVAAVSNHMGYQSRIGRGKKIISFTYLNCNFGPIYVEKDEEVKAVTALAQAKIEEREYRDRNGGRRTNGVYANTAAVRARSILSPDIVSYLDRAFTKRGMKENIVGRKKRNYPKRSAIIKQDPITGELIMPNGQNVIKDVKTEQSEENNPYGGKFGPLSVESTTSSINDPTAPAIRNTINEIITNTNEASAQVEVIPIEVPDTSQEKVQGKISKSLFTSKKKKIDKDLVNHMLQTSEANDKVIREQIANEKSDKTKSKKDGSATQKKTFNPLESTNELYIRKTDRVKELLEKKRKKEEKKNERALRRAQRSKYKGFGDSTKPQTVEQHSRFTRAQRIGGRKMVLKENGEVVEMTKKALKPQVEEVPSQVPSQEECPPTPQTPHMKRPHISNEEADIIDKLISFVPDDNFVNFETLDPVISLPTDTTNNKNAEATVVMDMELEELQSGGPSFQDLF